MDKNEERLDEDIAEEETAYSDQIEQILEFYKDKPIKDKPEDKADDSAAPPIKRVAKKITGIFKGRAGYTVSSGENEDIHESAYGLNSRTRLILTYGITAAVCLAVLIGSYRLAIILPGDESETARYAEELRGAKDYVELKESLAALNGEMDVYRTSVAEKAQASSDVTDYDNTKAELREQIDQKTAELSGLNTAIADKSAQLEAIETEIAAKSGNMLTLPPGRYVVGQNNISPGKYSIIGTGSFAVAGSDHSSKLNIAISGSPYEVELFSGDMISMDCTVKFTPVI